MPGDPGGIDEVKELDSIDGGKWVLFWTVVMLVTHVMIILGLALSLYILLYA